MNVRMDLKLVSLIGTQLVRNINTTSCVCGKRNFRKFPLYNKRGTRLFKQQQARNPDPDIPIYGKRNDDYFPIIIANF